jgi:cation diffusion facilitator CzcD-associated flavoprotein CzcO
MANWLREKVSVRAAYAVTRWRNVLLGMWFFNLARKKPEKTKKGIIELIRKELPDYDVDTHFTPRYNPWDQRLCLVPDSDLFQSIRDGRATVATGEIDCFTANGIKLKSGEELPADIIVTATGLKLILLGGMQVSVDGEAKNMARTMTYKGMMYSDVPNLASCFGYTNASWTLKCDLTCEYICRLLNYMDRRGYVTATPRRDAGVTEAPWLPLTSGYIERARDVLPRQGTVAPWKLHQNYALDMLALRYGKVDDGTMQFAKAPAKPVQTQRTPALAAE